MDSTGNGHHLRFVTINKDAPLTGNRLTDTPPRVENLAQMLQFQDKAVVSRMLVKNRRQRHAVRLPPARG